MKYIFLSFSVFCLSLLSLRASAEDMTQTNLSELDSAWVDSAKSSALRGNRLSQVLLGVYYRDGLYGVEQDYERAIHWFRIAAQNDSREGQYYLAEMYFNGHGVPIDFTSASYWARTSAELGEPRAQSLLSYLYISGKGVPLDVERSYMWGFIAAANGDADAARIRDYAAAQLDSDHIRELQMVASSCLRGGYQDCN